MSRPCRPLTIPPLVHSHSFCVTYVRIVRNPSGRKLTNIFDTCKRQGPVGGPFMKNISVRGIPTEVKSWFFLFSLRSKRMRGLMCLYHIKTHDELYVCLGFRVFLHLYKHESTEEDRILRVDQKLNFI